MSCRASSTTPIARPASCSVLGVGRGAAVLPPAAPGEPCLLDHLNEIDGSLGLALCMPAGGSRLPASHQTIDDRLHYVKQDGPTVFKFAVKKSQELTARLLDRNGLDGTAVDLFVSHQANRRIIEATAERLGMSQIGR